ncbi:septal ring factor EnvC (AmiA/AmiB activator) [Chromohalobacter marismortui]|uniref:Septal ring factor EnvC (AmiA/AmiB activator) n=1 Tax=Chromohalobacter marismortui TaxID=42055 RepID=A0A4R7NNW7_9GAMM|nr:MULTISPECIES: peptidoglycan DD-metalloendopeptidase family protein [Chromohalobacter]MCI0509960.1 peptidoglycan DD-metalloendopeptidase family protein [Chromohalobacter sp.]MCI0593108.1 peptidoglycan DD-metalloendopeptidase family protein [Chromohalobacter sp.]TDU22141.1 septal ring factor EnvC (AmiA/AmiB activator) [Chromohalobacter marismortui]
MSTPTSSKRIAMACAMAISCGWLSLGTLAAWAQSSPEDVRRQLEALGEHIQQAQSRLAGTRDARDEARHALRKVETQLAETQQRLTSLQREQDQLDQEVAELKQQRQTLEEERRRQRAALATQLNALYRLGPTPQLKLLLNQTDPARLDRLQQYLNHLNQARQERLDDLAKLEDQLDATQRALQSHQQRLDSLASELAERRETLSDQRRKRETILAKYRARYTTQQAKLAALSEDREAAEQLLDRMRDRLERLDQAPPSTAIEQTQGELPWPVQGDILASYGHGGGVDRNGIVIGAEAGTPVMAVHAGRVVFANWMRGFGNLVIIDHGDDIMTLYAHLQRFDVNVGARVERGTTIAAVGNSGGRASPALYFAVRENGDPIDPSRWIANR